MTFFNDIGDRLKQYESNYTQYRATKGLPLVARLDGRAFHTFTRGLRRPFDDRLSEAMIETTKYLVEETHALTGYTQSDEITLIWYVETDAAGSYMFDGKTQKLVSTLAALASVKFFELISKSIPEKAKLMPTFDCRIFQPPSLEEAALAFIWRELDATKNSISMAAGSYFSDKELHKKSGSEKQEMLFSIGINWNDYPAFFKRGTYVQRKVVKRSLSDSERNAIPEKHRPEPDAMFIRSEITECTFPPVTKIKNLVDVIFNKADPEVNYEV